MLTLWYSIILNNVIGRVIGESLEVWVHGTREYGFQLIHLEPHRRRPTTPQFTSPPVHTSFDEIAFPDPVTATSPFAYPSPGDILVSWLVPVPSPPLDPVSKAHPSYVWHASVFRDPMWQWAEYIDSSPLGGGDFKHASFIQPTDLAFATSSFTDHSAAEAAMLRHAQWRNQSAGLAQPSVAPNPHHLDVPIVFRVPTTTAAVFVATHPVPHAPAPPLTGTGARTPQVNAQAVAQGASAKSNRCASVQQAAPPTPPLAAGTVVAIPRAVVRALRAGGGATGSTTEDTPATPTDMVVGAIVATAARARAAGAATAHTAAAPRSAGPPLYSRARIAAAAMRVHADLVGGASASPYGPHARARRAEGAADGGRPPRSFTLTDARYNVLFSDAVGTTARSPGGRSAGALADDDSGSDPIVHGLNSNISADGLLRKSPPVPTPADQPTAPVYTHSGRIDLTEFSAPLCDAVPAAEAGGGGVTGGAAAPACRLTGTTCTAVHAVPCEVIAGRVFCTWLRSSADDVDDSAHGDAVPTTPAGAVEVATYAILGSGYAVSSTETLVSSLSKFCDDVAACVKGLKGTDPWRQLLGAMRVVSIFEGSLEAGASHPRVLGGSETAQAPAAAPRARERVVSNLDCSYGVSVERALSCDYARMLPLGAAVDADVVVALVNDPLHGGTGGSAGEVGVASVSTGATMVNTFIHELGHAHGDLSDEYTYGIRDTMGVRMVNCARADAVSSGADTDGAAPVDVPWQRWLPGTIGGVGAVTAAAVEDQTMAAPQTPCSFENYGSSSVGTRGSVCLMKSGRMATFCAACREAMVKSIIADSPHGALNPRLPLASETVYLFDAAPYNEVSLFAGKLLLDEVYRGRAEAISAHGVPLAAPVAAAAPAPTVAAAAANGPTAPRAVATPGRAPAAAGRSRAAHTASADVWSASSPVWATDALPGNPFTAKVEWSTPTGSTVGFTVPYAGPAASETAPRRGGETLRVTYDSLRAFVGQTVVFTARIVDATRYTHPTRQRSLLQPWAVGDDGVTSVLNSAKAVFRVHVAPPAATPRSVGCTARNATAAVTNIDWTVTPPLAYPFPDYADGAATRPRDTVYCSVCDRGHTCEVVTLGLSPAERLTARAVRDPLAEIETTIRSFLNTHPQLLQAGVIVGAGVMVVSMLLTMTCYCLVTRCCIHSRGEQIEEFSKGVFVLYKVAKYLLVAGTVLSLGVAVYVFYLYNLTSSSLLGSGFARAASIGSLALYVLLQLFLAAVISKRRLLLFIVILALIPTLAVSAAGTFYVFTIDLSVDRSESSDAYLETLNTSGSDSVVANPPPPEPVSVSARERAHNRIDDALSKLWERTVRQSPDDICLLQQRFRCSGFKAACNTFSGRARPGSGGSTAVPDATGTARRGVTPPSSAAGPRRDIGVGTRSRVALAAATSTTATASDQAAVSDSHATAAGAASGASASDAVAVAPHEVTMPAYCSPRCNESNTYSDPCWSLVQAELREANVIPRYVGVGVCIYLTLIILGIVALFIGIRPKVEDRRRTMFRSFLGLPEAKPKARKRKADNTADDGDEFSGVPAPATDDDIRNARKGLREYRRNLRSHNAYIDDHLHHENAF